MAYTPINIDAYTNAYSGALAGMAISGWIVDPTSAEYSSVTAIAGGFAKAFDLVWNSATALNWLQIQSIQSVCQEQFTGHAPGSLDNAALAQASNWAVPAAACAALVLEGDAFVASEGITPNTPGGGGDGGTRTPGTAYVADSVAVTGNGSPGSPFKTLTQAIAALTADAKDTSSLLVYPGDYSSEDPIVWSGGSLIIASANNVARIWQGTVSLAILPAITIQAAVTQFNGVAVNQMDDSIGFGCSFINCECRGNISSPGGVAKFQNSEIYSGVDISAQNLRFVNSELSTGEYTIGGGSTTLESCTFNGASTFTCSGPPAVLILDGWTKAWADIVNPTLNNMTYDLRNATT
jgi:hypothetical protein